MWSVDVGHHSTGDEGCYGEQEEAIIDSEAMRLVRTGADDYSAGCYDQCYAEPDANGNLRLRELPYVRLEYCAWSKSNQRPLTDMS